MRLTFRVHALQAMFRRNISVDDVKTAMQSGKIIELYPQDKPYPSRLVLGWSGARPIHVVAAENTISQEQIIITVYEPDPDRWDSAFEKRKR